MIARYSLDCSLHHRYVKEDLDEFFKHENQAYPPALSKLGRIRTSTKSDLLTCLKGITAPLLALPINPIAEITIIDGVAVVNMLRLSKNF